MIKLLYTIKAYTSKAAAESGKVAPESTSQTDNIHTAQNIAQGYAKDYGCGLIADYETGNRGWFKR